MRIMPCYNNTTWGVQVSPFAPNKYGIAMSFDDLETKNRYFEKKIFWKGWIEDLKKSKAKINTINSAVEATFYLTLEDINASLPENIKPYTYDEVLQKDLVASYDDLTGQIKYWAVKIESAGALNLFKVVAKLDEFANYDIVHGLYRSPTDSMFLHSTQPKIEQATIQQYFKDQNGIYRTMNGQNDYGFLSEPFDDTPEKLFLPTAPLKEISADYANLIVNGHDNPHYDEINAELNNKEHWKVAIFDTKTFNYVKDKNKTAKDGFTSTNIGGGMNFENDMIAVFNNLQQGYHDNLLGDFPDWMRLIGINNDLPYKLVLVNINDSSNGSPNWYTEVDYTQFFTNAEDSVYAFSDIMSFITNSVDEKMELFDWWDDKDGRGGHIEVATKAFKEIDDKDTNYQTLLPVALMATQKDTSALGLYNMQEYISINRQSVGRGLLINYPQKIFDKGIVTEEFKLPQHDWKKITADTGKINPYAYTKLLKSPYQKVRIIGTDGATFDIREEFLNTDTFKLKMNVIPMVDLNFTGISIIPINPTENTLYTGTSRDYRNEYVFREFAKNGNILKTNAYLDMLTNEQNSTNTQSKILGTNALLAKIFGPVNAVLGTASGGIAGSFSKEHQPYNTAAGAISGFVGGTENATTSIIGAQQNISQFNSKIQDMKESPNKINGAALSLQVNKYSTGLKPQIQFLSIPISNLTLNAWYFHVLGASMHVNADINNFLDNHEFWDHIQANDTFEIFALELATQVRQNISNALSQGIQITHIRKDFDKLDADGTEHFKGVRYYNVTNKQMSEDKKGSFKDIWD